MALPRWACSKGHDRVEWGVGGGLVIKRDKTGREVLTDDRRCWYCGSYNIPTYK